VKNVLYTWVASGHVTLDDVTDVAQGARTIAELLPLPDGAHVTVHVVDVKETE
jgi:hypothetical protein